jgi:hypothetical protein
MVIEIYGKQNCSKCESTKRKVSHFLDKWGVAHMVEVVFRDMDTVDGAAEGDFHDVFQIPSVLLKPRHDPYTVLARWDGIAPPAQELHERLCA